MEVVKVSEACIKPSSPTPDHLKTYSISLLDQIIPPIYIPIILYYSNQQTTVVSNDFISKRSMLLKKSLSETLSRFYPLAGRIKDEHSIDCNDEGVCYIEATADCSLSDYLIEPLASMEKLIPEMVVLNFSTPGGSYLLKIQETTFACGGFTIGILGSHIVSDGTALSSLLKDWAANAMICQSNQEISSPYLEIASVFPPSDAFSKEESSMFALVSPFMKKMKACSKRIVFDASAIASLKDRVISSGVENPTRVEVVTALLSKCLMAVLKARSGKDKPLAMIHSVNLRRRAVPQIPERSLGNIVWFAAALYKHKEAEAELGSLVCPLRESTGKMDGDFVNKLQGDGGYARLCDIMKETREVFGNPELVFSGGVDFVSFSSWCNFGLFDIDFGWGKPVWTSCLGSSRGTEIFASNSVILMDARIEKGIEAWVLIDEDDMLLLEKEEELLQYASVDPIPWTSISQD